MSDSRLSRRDVIRGALATTLAALVTGCGGGGGSQVTTQPAATTSSPSSSSPSTPVSQTLDAIVIGAGAAGIGAARSVKATGRTVLVLEAQEHIGGRCRSDNTFPVPFDPGAQFVGQAQSLNNVLFPIMQQFGLTTIPAETVPAAFFDPATGLGADSIQLGLFLLTFSKVAAAIQTIGPALTLGAPDLSIQDLLISEGLDDAPYLGLTLQMLMEVVDGGSAATQSTLDLYNETEFIPLTFIYPTNDSLYFPSGYGNFIARLADGLPIRTNMPVTNIDWSGANVVVTAGGQQFTAKTVILTASINVLKSGAIAFNPPLPASHTSALGGVLMGHAYKTELEFRSNPFNGSLGVQPGHMFQTVPLNQGNSTTFIVNYFAEQFPTSNTYMMAIAEAEQALALEAMGPAAAGAALCAQLEKPFPGITAAWTGRVLASNWASNPYTRGCISYCTPGNASARTTLAQSIGNKIWLAGEAISVHGHATVHGAWASGEQAAYGAMQTVGALGQ